MNSRGMSQQVLVFCLPLLWINCGLTQYVTSSTTVQTIESTETPLSGLYNMSDNTLPDYTLNEIRAGMPTGSLDALQNISVPNVDLVAVKENVSDTQKGLEISSNIFIMESNSTEKKNISSFDKTMNSSKIKTQYPNIQTPSTTSSYEHESQLQLPTIMDNHLNSTRGNNSSTDMVYLQPVINDIYQTSLQNDTNVDIVNTTAEILDISSLPFTENTSSAGFGNKVKLKMDSVNISQSGGIQVDKNITTSNSSSDIDIKLPEIKWRPGMKQPQTISDLIRVAGADIKFITTQFGGNFSVNGNESKVLNEKEKINTEIEANASIHDVKTNADDNHELISDNKSSTTIQNDGFFSVNEFQTPELSNIKVSNVFAVSSGQNLEEDDSRNSNTLNMHSMKSDDRPPRTMQTGNDFLATKNNMFPDVVIRSPGNVESSRLDFVPGITSRNAPVVPDLTFVGFNSQNSDQTSRGNGWMNPTRQSQTDSRRLISFGRNPEYLIGTSGSVQIPQSIIQNHLPNAESSERRDIRRNNDVMFRRENTDFAETGMNSGMNRVIQLTRLPTEEVRPIFSETTRFGTSRNIARSDNLRRDEPRAVDFPVDGMPSNQESVGRLTIINRSNRFTPRREEFRSSANELSFENVPTGRRLDNSVQVTERNRNVEMPSDTFRNSITSEDRQNVGTIPRDTGSVDFSRRRDLGSRFGRNSFVNQGSNNMARNTDVTSEFFRPRHFDGSLISRTENRVTDRSFPRGNIATGFRDETIRPRFSRAEMMPRFTGFGGVGQQMFPVDTRTFHAPIRPLVFLPRTVFMPTDMFPSFPPRTPFPFI